MEFVCRSSELCGEVPVPGSKSHTIRGLALALLASGESVLEQPLAAADTASASAAVEALGARITRDPGGWTVQGGGSCPRLRQKTIDVGNSGTTLNIMMGIAGLLPSDQHVLFTGDRQVQSRPAGPLLQSLRDLGAAAKSQLDNERPPLLIGGRLRGGHTVLPSLTSQYLTSLLIACPLADRETVIEVPLLHEAAYVAMTLDWLKQQDIQLEYTPEMNWFRIPGGQCYKPFRRRIPADFSSATFFLAAGALPGNRVVCRGLDLGDSQGDKAVVDYLRAMGARIKADEAGIEVAAGRLKGLEIDLNDTPDALPAMAAVACFAEGETRLVNVPQARIKETDRIRVMAEELGKMGADIEELPDGLRIRGDRPLHGAAVNGHGDHRVIMALALAGLASPGETRVSTADAAAVTFPDFARLMQKIGAEIAVAQSV